MFGRRKSRKQEEPLVPHGLIWQATDEPEELAQAARLEQPASSTEVIEMSLRRENPPGATVPAAALPDAKAQGSAQPDPSATRLGAISPPIRWPSPKSASVIRRTPPPNRVTASPAPVSPAVPQVPQPQVIPQIARVIQSETKPAVIEIPAVPALVHRESRRQETLRQIRRSLRQKTENAYAGSAQGVVLFLGKARTAYAAINLPAKFSKARQGAKQKVFVLIAGCRAAGNQMRSGWGSVTPRIARLNSATRKAASESLRTSISQCDHLVQRVRDHKVRIRIERPARVQAFFEGSKMAWARRRESIRREPRLWTSMAMAALSALLAVGVISAVSHNAPHAHAANKSIAPAENNSSAINPVIVVAPRTASEGVAKAIPPASTRSADSVQASSTKGQRNSSRRETTRRVRHRTGDDYVAPNTYRYYGTNGKSTGQ